MKREARRILRAYGVDVNVSRPLRELGLGAQQMVAIARAVQIDARVVIMDEPTSSLEQREVETLFGVIERLKADGIAIVYVSHRLDELFRICDRVTVMRDGRVVHGSSMAEIDRLRLVSLMLGRDMAEVSEGGATAFDSGAGELPEDRKSEGIIPNLSVRENIVLAALPRISRSGLVDRAKQDEIVDYFVKRLRIKASSPDQKVGELSGGNQQKVLLARWLCLNPKVLLLDEPTRGIDVGAKAEVQAVINELAKEGLGVVLISSELEEVIEGSDRVVVLKEGRVVGELRGDEVTESALMESLAAAPTAEGLADD
jgi:ABC-type sugar transport system ATPase subunit